MRSHTHTHTHPETGASWRFVTLLQCSLYENRRRSLHTVALLTTEPDRAVTSPDNPTTTTSLPPIKKWLIHSTALKIGEKSGCGCVTNKLMQCIVIFWRRVRSGGSFCRDIFQKHILKGKWFRVRGSRYKTINVCTLGVRTSYKKILFGAFSSQINSGRAEQLIVHPLHPFSPNVPVSTVPINTTFIKLGLCPHKLGPHLLTSPLCTFPARPSPVFTPLGISRLF